MTNYQIKQENQEYFQLMIRKNGYFVIDFPFYDKLRTISHNKIHETPIF